jgi:hypothetical protein
MPRNRRSDFGQVLIDSFLDLVVRRHFMLLAETVAIRLGPW